MQILKKSSKLPVSRKKKKTNRSTPVDRYQKRLQQMEDKIKRLNVWKKRLSTLLKFGQKAATITNLDELLIILVDEAKTVLEADRATVFLVDKKENILWSKVAIGTETIRIPLDKGIAGSVVSTGRLLNIKEVYEDPRFNPEVDRKTGYRTRSILAAPLRNTKNKVIGVFQVLNRKGSASFDSQDEEVLTLLADQAASVVENAQLYQEIRKTSYETIIRLAGAAEYKDHDTKAHLWRVAQYSGILAENMGFSSEWVENLKMASPMHDIGKIGVPDAIINKPGKLSPEEWDEMKKHPTYGMEILKDSENELMQMSASVAWNHHERWDGKGYPRGIQGEAIPLEARIVSLADVFDALTTKRSYKPAFALDETIAIIESESGKQFDPKVVDAFRQSIGKITVVWQQHQTAASNNPSTR